jgi:hypothetical protein
MAIYYFVPEADVSTGAGWTAISIYGAETPWQCTRGGPILDLGNMVEHAGPVGTNNNTSFKVHAADPGLTIGAASFFGDVRVYGIRLGAWASLYETATTASYQIRLDYGSGEMDETMINFPGTHQEQTVMGPAFLQFVNSFHGAWVYKNPFTGNDFTSGQLDSMQFVCRATGKAQVWELWMDVDLRTRCQVVPGNPHYNNQAMSPWSPITWGFNNAGDGVQKKYQVRIFTTAQYIAALGAGTVWTTTGYTLDSGEVRSARNYHDFGRYIGAKKYRGIADGTWAVAIRVCKDYKGSDWWSKDYVQNMVVTGYTDTIVTPTPGQTFTTTSRPGFVVTTTIASGDQTGSDWRIYRQPTAGWAAGTFDPDTTDLDPYYEVHKDGTGGIMQPPLEYSLSNTAYKLAVRHYEIDFGDATPWAVQDFSLNALAPPTPQTYTFTSDLANNRVGYDIQWYSNVLVDETQGLRIQRLVNGYDNELVRLATPDIDHGLRPLGVRLAGASGGYISIANNTSLNSTSLEVESGLYQLDWSSTLGATLGARWLTGTNNRSWWFRLKSDRTLELQWSTAGTSGTVLTATSTTTIPVFAANTEAWFRVKLSVSNPYTVQFHWSTDRGFNWTQVGTTITGGAATSLFNSTSNGVIEVGATDTGTANLAAAIHTHFVLRSTVAGTIILSWDATGANALTTNVGGAFTVAGTNTSYYYRVTGNDYEFPQNIQLFYLPSYYVKDTVVNEYQFSPSGLASPTTITKQEIWLKPIGADTDAARVLLADSWVTRDTTKVRAVRQPLGKTLPVVNKSIKERGEKFTYNFTVIGATAVARMERVLNSGNTMVLSTPKRRYYVDLAGDWSQKEQPFDGRKGEADARVFTVPLVEVTMPYVPGFV